MPFFIIIYEMPSVHCFPVFLHIKVHRMSSPMCNTISIVSLSITHHHNKHLYGINIKTTLIILHWCCFHARWKSSNNRFPIINSMHHSDILQGEFEFKVVFFKDLCLYFHSRATCTHTHLDFSHCSVYRIFILHLYLCKIMGNKIMGKKDSKAFIHHFFW